MAEAGRDIGEEILEGIRQLKRGEHGRIVNMPAILSTGPSDSALPEPRRLT